MRADFEAASREHRMTFLRRATLCLDIDDLLVIKVALKLSYEQRASSERLKATELRIMERIQAALERVG